MAKGSHTGWFGLPRDKRHCHHCGERLTLTTSGPLWFEDGPTRRVYHMACRLTTHPKETQ